MQLAEIGAATIPANPEIRRRMASSKKARSTKHYVANHDGVEVGFVAVDAIPEADYFVLYELFVIEIFRGSGLGGRALLAPKLSYKAQAIASQPFPDQINEARAIAAEIGWIETSLPAAAAGAIRAVEELLSAGHAEDTLEIYNQLMVFEAFEHGLLATWETPGALVCVQRSA